MTKSQFLEQYRVALKAEFPWARDEARLDKFMASVERTITNARYLLNSHAKTRQEGQRTMDTTIELGDATREIAGLDAIQIAALRKADRICFFHRPQPDASDETSYIDAIKQHKQSAADPFAPRDSAIVIPCAYRVTDYSRFEERIAYKSEAFNAFEMIYAHDNAWQTTASLLRVGDKVTLHWQRGGWTTESMKNATPKFYGDQLELEVKRGERVLTFHVATRVGEDNSARMIRRA